MRRAPKASKDKYLASVEEARAIPAEVSQRAAYVGSIEHKGYTSPAGNPRPRATASQCPRIEATRWPELTRALQAAIRVGCVGRSVDPGGYPRYVWGTFEGRWYEARHLSVPHEGYKAFPVETFELPEGAAERLARGLGDD